jgi:branched-chain amino acid transport system permease protein
LYNRHIDQALVTVGVSLVAVAVMGGWFGNDARFLPTPAWFMNAVTIGDAIIPVDRFIYIGVAAILLTAMLCILNFTRIGLIIRAGVENRSMVSALGINVRLAFSTVFFIGGFAAGVGGVLISVFSYGVTPLMGGSWLIYGFIVVVVGGMGSITGSAIAAMLLGITNQFANYYLTGLGDFVVVLILATVLLTKPSGLLGKVNH